MHPAVNLALIPEFLSRCYAACERTKVIYVQYRLVSTVITTGRDGCKLQSSYALQDVLYNQTQTAHTAQPGSPAAEKYTIGMLA